MTRAQVLLLVIGVLIFILIANLQVQTGARLPGRRAQTGVTLAQFSQLDDGMSYRSAVGVLGSEGVLISSSYNAGVTEPFTTRMYQWPGRGQTGANMNAIFQRDKLITKAQFGLR